MSGLHGRTSGIVQSVEEEGVHVSCYTQLGKRLIQHWGKEHENVNVKNRIYPGVPQGRETTVFFSGYERMNLYQPQRQ